MTPIEFAKTQDGSWTCFNPDVGEHYHNLAGAYTEAKTIYVEPTQMAKRLQQSPHLTVLDPFLGLGYNTLACLEAFTELKIKHFPQARLTMVCFEHDPEILARIPTAFGQLDRDDLKLFLPLFIHNTYYRTHDDLSALFREEASKSESGINLKVVVGDTRTLIQAIPDACVDVIYHDAFSPRKQPELWTTQLFQQYHRVLQDEHGTVFTYSAAASIRKAFRDAGFSIYPLAIPQNKSGTLASCCKRTDLPDFSPLELGLVNSKSGVPYEDSAELALPQEVIVAQRDERYQHSDLPSSSSVHKEYGHLKRL